MGRMKIKREIFQCWCWSNCMASQWSNVHTTANKYILEQYTDVTARNTRTYMYVHLLASHTENA